MRGEEVPSQVRNTIHSIREIIGEAYSEEEIFLALKDSDMDPNDTVQHLLSQDHFHEVKRKREKKKENSNIKDFGDLRIKSGNQAREGRENAVERGSNQRNYIQSSQTGSTSTSAHVPRDTRNYQRATVQLNRPTITASMGEHKEPGTAYVSEECISASGTVRSLSNESLTNMRQASISRGSWSAIAQGNKESDTGSHALFTTTKGLHTTTSTASADKTGQEVSITLKQYSEFSTEENSVPMTPYSISNQQLPDHFDPSISDSNLCSDVHFSSSLEMPEVAHNDHLLTECGNSSQQHFDQREVFQHNHKKDIESMLHGLNIKDEQYVIMPDHLQISEDRCKDLTFGSFGAHLNKSTHLKDMMDSYREENSKDQESSQSMAKAVLRDSNSDVFRPPFPQSSQQKSSTKVDHERVSIAGLTTLLEHDPLYIQEEQRPDGPSGVPNFVQKHNSSDCCHYAFSRSILNTVSRVSEISSSDAHRYYQRDHNTLPGQQTSVHEGLNYLLSSTTNPAVHARRNGESQNTLLPLHESTPVISLSSNLTTSHISSSFTPYQPLYGSPSTTGFSRNPEYSQDETLDPNNLISSSSYYHTNLSPSNILPSYKDGPSSGHALNYDPLITYGGYSSSTAISDSLLDSRAGGMIYDRSSRPEFQDRDITMPRQQVETSTLWNSLTPQDFSLMHSDSYFAVQSQGRQSIYGDAQATTSFIRSSQSMQIKHPVPDSIQPIFAGWFQSGSTALQSPTHTQQQLQPLGAFYSVNGNLGGYHQESNPSQQLQSLGAFDSLNGDLGAYQQQSRFWTNAF